jgi:hypothetical protein
MSATDDPFAEDSTLPHHENMDKALDRRPRSRFRDWLARSTPVGTLLALSFVLLLTAIILSQTFGYLDRSQEREAAKAEREDIRQELLCRSQFTNDVTQIEGLVLLQISLVVSGSVDDEPEVVAKANAKLLALYPQFEAALARRDKAERVCAGRPAA